MSTKWQEWKNPDVITQTRIKNSTRCKIWGFKILFIVHPIWRINSNPRCKYHLGGHDKGKDTDR
ncbi:MAG: hypothetical protein E6L04_07270 [Thaumarchaeota archaeon]|nr:MAG: hypothetical protein E6L04_07270 [Nitrososphaerota archaeon]TLX92272.1 MAG: hypothetical protein E6K97_02135 [Nitrososphaerota archaeon]